MAIIVLNRSRRNLGLDMVRITETAALTAAKWMGRGEADSAHQVATEAMYEALNTLAMRGHIVIGEGKNRDGQTSIGTGVAVGTGEGPEMDVVVDPLDGARLLKFGRSGALSIAAVAPKGSMWRPTPARYMEKLIVDRAVADGLVAECLDAPIAWTLALIARFKKKSVQDLVVFMLERPRHEALVEEIRAAGARVWLRADGDISGAILAAMPTSDVDLMIGIGGVTEGTLAACAVKALGGGMLGRLAPQSVDEREKLVESGLNLGQIYTGNEILKNDEVYIAATGITNGTLLRGIRFKGDLAESNSLILRGETGTRRVIHADHLIGGRSALK